MTPSAFPAVAMTPGMARRATVSAKRESIFWSFSIAELLSASG
jgi:hypothetical protein